jgi:hypothetical protein
MDRRSRGENPRAAATGGRGSARVTVVTAATLLRTVRNKGSGWASLQVLIFAVNPLHDVIHLVLGGAWLAAAPRHRAARLANLSSASSSAW